MPNTHGLDQELLQYPEYPRRGWIGVDLDGTLAKFDSTINSHYIGMAVPHMLERVRYWIKTGRTVKIFTARAGNAHDEERINQWCMRHGLPKLEITNRKDHQMIALWDDRAVGVVRNIGVPILPAPMTLWQLLCLRLLLLVGGSAFMEADRRHLKEHFFAVKEVDEDFVVSEE